MESAHLLCSCNHRWEEERKHLTQNPVQSFLTRSGFPRPSLSGFSFSFTNIIISSLLSPSLVIHSIKCMALSEGLEMTGQVPVHRIPTDSNTIDYEILSPLIKFIDCIPTVLHESTMCLAHRSNLGGIANINDERP